MILVVIMAIMISLVVAIVVVEVLVMGGVPFRAALAKVRTGKQQLTMPIEEVPIGTHGVGHELTTGVMGKNSHQRNFDQVHDWKSNNRRRPLSVRMLVGYSHRMK